jgi:hypothetical protein
MTFAWLVVFYAGYVAPCFFYFWAAGPTCCRLGALRYGLGMALLWPLTLPLAIIRELRK